ncbi:hypothetical protein N7532_003940 [Penicillium argentinense]|uniref:Uncharacterized protein n=1 Tax=Penicillium argentinense TaxID=1131581 RepID=A0A9W9KF04_9EURO|nr:uncharacterized protein N7532_003940 [Penicillium argentinense]KAJ5103411.1 hypothetical protein N7532_003940 [Penicillium argentinense]
MRMRGEGETVDTRHCARYRLTAFALCQNCCGGAVGDPHSRDGANTLDTGVLHDPVCFSALSAVRYHHTPPPSFPLTERRCLARPVEILRETSGRNPPGRQIPPWSAVEACIAGRTEPYKPHDAGNILAGICLDLAQPVRPSIDNTVNPPDLTGRKLSVTSPAQIIPGVSD